MNKNQWHIGFATPAFLGNAGQQAQWRTPPIKALLRQWWRVLEWNRKQHNLESLRRQEGEADIWRQVHAVRNQQMQRTGDGQ